MARKTSEEIQELCKELGVDRLFSWSRYNTINNSLYEYYLKYVAKIEEDNSENAYSALGTVSHDIMEDFYNGKIKYNDMLGRFDDGWIVAIDIADFKFNRTDGTKNENVKQKYQYDLRHFFQNHIPVEHKIDSERFIIIKVGEYMFQGYIDAIFKDDGGNYHIIDWKSSSIYKGKKAIQESGQLVLYAEGLRQLGVPLEKIKIGWNFLKYVSVEIQQANGKANTREIERCDIGNSLKANAKMWLNKLGYKEDIKHYIGLLEETNDIECLPKDVREKYKFNDCYVYVDLTQKLIDDLKRKIIETLDDVVRKEQQYKITKDDSIFFEDDESVKKQSFYFANLCEYSASLHKPYKKYLQELDDKKKGRIFSSNTTSNTELDLSWLDEL